MFNYYKVGGCVRDAVMGVPAKDIDLLAIGGTFEELEEDVRSQGGTIYISKPEFLTIRCNYPKIGPCDIRLARKDGDYSDGRRPDSVSLADDVRDDINTRDFTMNALLQDLESGEIIDYVGGIDDIENKTINTVGFAKDRFEEDYLRLLRAVRFSITKGFSISLDIHDCLQDAKMIEGLKNVSVERIYEEMFKCFKFNTIKTLEFLETYSKLRDQVFNGILWLRPTLELK